MASQQPLDITQQELVNVVKAAHQTLSLARKLRVPELARRIAEAKIASDRALAEAQELIRMDLDAEVEQHAANLDQALIGAYTAGVPILRIATEGFGNRYPGGVQEQITKLRAAGMVGSSEGFHRNTTPADEMETHVEFPKPVDVESVLREATTVGEASFVAFSELSELMAASDREPAIWGREVTLTVDLRDPYFKSIAPKMNQRYGAKNKNENTLVLFRAEGNDNIAYRGDRDDGSGYWIHPVKRWVADHPVEVSRGFDAAVAAL